MWRRGGACTGARRLVVLARSRQGQAFRTRQRQNDIVSREMADARLRAGEPDGCLCPGGMDHPGARRRRIIADCHGYARRCTCVSKRICGAASGIRSNRPGYAAGRGLAFLVAGGVTSIPAAIAVFALVKRPVFALYVSFALIGSGASDCYIKSGLRLIF